MYWDYERCEKYLAENPAKPLIQCEYAHAMGNSMGGFREYWELIRREPKYQGGFIWDFVDQSLHKKGRNGVTVYGYGGDWNPYDPSDQNFCDNGLIGPDRIPNPHMEEVRYYYQSVWTSWAGDAGNTVEVLNENFFRGLENYDLHWEVLCDGTPLRRGVVDGLKAAPQQRVRITLPYDPATLPAAGELLLDVAYKLKTAEGILPAGHTAARAQLPIREYVFTAPAAKSAAEGESLFVADNHKDFLIVAGNGLRLDFSRKTGFITRYEVRGLDFLADGSTLRPNFWRAPTDNDFGAGLQHKMAVWKQPEMKLKTLTHAEADGIVTVKAGYEMPGVQATLEIEYAVDNTGAVTIAQSLHATPGAEVPDMFRFGMRFEMPEAFDRLQYYGRGPGENYADRKSSAFVGLYRQSVDEQFHPYIRPQETGTKSDLRWWHCGHRRTGSYGDLRRSVLRLGASLPAGVARRRPRKTAGTLARGRKAEERFGMPRQGAVRTGVRQLVGRAAAARIPDSLRRLHVPPEDHACDPPISRATRPKAGVPRGFRPFYRPQDLPGRQKMRIFVVR